MIGINGSQERIVSNRFRATISGNLASARLYWQPGTGYSRGNGGVIRLRLLPDDGSDAHAPNMSATPLATAEFTPGAAAQGDRAIFADSTFTSQQPLVAGQIYHLVMDNVAPDPRENYISSNNAITHEQNDRPSRWVSSTDWGTLRGSRPAGSTGTFAWSDYTRNASNGNYYVPILQLTTADGQRQGVANMESGAVDPDRIFTLGADEPIRERFRPTRGVSRVCRLPRHHRPPVRCTGASCRAATCWPAASSRQAHPTTPHCKPTPTTSARFSGMTPKSMVARA